jgi:putative endonuclease
MDGPRKSTHDVGRVYEDRVATYLSERGWRILGRNVRFGRREIDLVVRRADVVAFVEVKGRGGPGFGHPLEAITWKKRREIAAVALWWIQRFGEPGLCYRFDAVAVEPAKDGKLAVQHVEDAWRLD